MVNAKADLLHDAIARNAAMVLSLPSAGMLRHHKSRFLAEEYEGFWAESVREDAPLIDTLIADRQPCGISFKSVQTKVVFAATALRREERFRINATTVVEAVLLQFPHEIKAVQRRCNYRVHIPLNADWVSVRIWRIGEKADLRDRPMAAQEIATKIRDLSTGGMGVTLTGTNGLPPKVTSLDRLRIEIARQDQRLLLEGRMKHPADAGTQTTVRAGLQFKSLQDDIQSRQMLAQLTKIVGELQREEIRRFRMGLDSE